MKTTPRTKKAINKLSKSEIPSEFMQEIEKELETLERNNTKETEVQSKLPALCELINIKHKFYIINSGISRNLQKKL